MRFNSKEHMAQELMSGKRFISESGLDIYFDTTCDNPFRCGADSILGSTWKIYEQNIWKEVNPTPKVVYEWMFLTTDNQWVISDNLATEETAANRFENLGYTYRKTGRSFEVEV